MEDSYEQSLKRLEEIAARLESGGMELEESLNLFEEGIGLYKSCAKKLDEAQGRIEMLVQQAEGFAAQPFDGTEEEA